METFIQYLEQHLGSCPYKAITTINCLGCGLQRSFILLLKGKIMASFYMYPALITMILMFVFLIVHLIFDIKNGAKILKYFYLINILLILVNYIYKV